MNWQTEYEKILQHIGKEVQKNTVNIIKRHVHIIFICFILHTRINN